MFKREGNNLSCEITISLKEALLGFDREITHLDGKKVEIIREEVTQPGYIMKITGEGMPIHNFSSSKGNLYLSHIINLPTSLTEEEKKIVEELFS